MATTCMENDTPTTPHRGSGWHAERGDEAPTPGVAGGAMDDEYLADRLQSRYGIPRHEAHELIALFGEYL